MTQSKLGLNIESFYFGKMHLRQQVKTEKVTDSTNFNFNFNFYFNFNFNFNSTNFNFNFSRMYIEWARDRWLLSYLFSLSFPLFVHHSFDMFSCISVCKNVCLSVHPCFMCVYLCSFSKRKLSGIIDTMTHVVWFGNLVLDICTKQRLLIFNYNDFSNN